MAIATLALVLTEPRASASEGVAPPHLEPTGPAAVPAGVPAPISWGQATLDYFSIEQVFLVDCRLGEYYAAWARAEDDSDDLDVELRLSPDGDVAGGSYEPHGELDFVVWRASGDAPHYPTVVPYWDGTGWFGVENATPLSFDQEWRAISTAGLSKSRQVALWVFPGTAGRSVRVSLDVPSTLTAGLHAFHVPQNITGARWQGDSLASVQGEGPGVDLALSFVPGVEDFVALVASRAAGAGNVTLAVELQDLGSPLEGGVVGELKPSNSSAWYYHVGGEPNVVFMNPLDPGTDFELYAYDATGAERQAESTMGLNSYEFVLFTGASAAVSHRLLVDSYSGWGRYQILSKEVEGGALSYSGYLSGQDPVAAYSCSPAGPGEIVAHVTVPEGLTVDAFLFVDPPGAATRGDADRRFEGASGTERTLRQAFSSGDAPHLLLVRRAGEGGISVIFQVDPASGEFDPTLVFVIPFALCFLGLAVRSVGKVAKRGPPRKRPKTARARPATPGPKLRDQFGRAFVRWEEGLSPKSSLPPEASEPRGPSPVASPTTEASPDLELEGFHEAAPPPPGIVESPPSKLEPERPRTSEREVIPDIEIEVPTVLEEPNFELEASPALELEASPALELEASPALELEASPALELEASPALELEVLPALELEALPALELEALPALELEASPALELEASPALELEALPEPDPEVETTPELEPEVAPEQDPRREARRAVELGAPRGPPDPLRRFVYPPEELAEMPTSRVTLSLALARFNVCVNLNLLLNAFALLDEVARMAGALGEPDLAREAEAKRRVLRELLEEGSPVPPHEVQALLLT
ncbi:MAG: hypothetical protein Kow0069_06900 [Promethearchaeota archaeon]